MLAHLSDRLNYANVVATISLFVVLGGGAYAATTLPRNSVGTKQLKRNAVDSSKVMNGSLRLNDLAASERAKLRGAAGAKGDAGAQGAKGDKGDPCPASDPGCVGPRGDKGDTGDPGPQGIGLEGIYGADSDGDVTLNANETLTRDMYYDDLTLNDGVALNPGGFRVFVRGTLFIGNTSRIARNGNPAASFTVGGAGLSPGTLGGSGAGTSTNDCTADDASNAIGGRGGQIFGGGIVNPPPVTAGGVGVFQSALSAIAGRDLTGAIVNGGSGGGGEGGCQGAGSGGGGIVVVAAREIVLTGSASITANGGNGQFNGASDGGGGGGGGVTVISSTQKPAALTISASGASTFPAGSAGRTYFFGRQ